MGGPKKTRPAVAVRSPRGAGDVAGGGTSSPEESDCSAPFSVTITAAAEATNLSVGTKVAAVVAGGAVVLILGNLVAGEVNRNLSNKILGCMRHGFVFEGEIIEFDPTSRRMRALLVGERADSA